LAQLVSLPFPDLQSANISYKLLSQLADCTPFGPALAPMKFPANIVQRTSTVEEIVNMSHLTALISKINKG
jgi:malate dehydrogenase (oxaloacetate-decarboxylating)(NADP+)